MHLLEEASTQRIDYDLLDEVMEATVGLGRHCRSLDVSLALRLIGLLRTICFIIIFETRLDLKMKLKRLDCANELLTQLFERLQLTLFPDVLGLAIGRLVAVWLRAERTFAP